MIEDFRLRVFVTVTEEQSFTKAASVLKISQPAVSQHISELEKTVGVKLFERLHGEIRLTIQGQVFLKHAADILEAYRSASDLFCPASPAIVRIKASDEVYTYIYDSLSAFSQIHPEVEFVRSEDVDSELSFCLKPAPKIMGGISATHNIVASIYLCCQPSETFSQTSLFESLRSVLADTLI